MNLLITKSDFETIGIQLPKNLEEDQLRRSIIEAQEFDLKPALGDTFYFDLVNNVTVDKYQSLLNGEINYVYETYNYWFTGGVKAALCYYTYARYLPYAGKKNTEFGMVQKTNPYSEQVSTQQMQIQMNDARSAAIGYMANVTKYLSHQKVLDSALYPLWNTGPYGSLVKCGDDYSPSVRITKVGNI